MKEQRAGIEYTDAVGVLERALTFGITPSLDTITSLTEELGRPQDGFASIQVAGTNGKTTVARMTAALLEAHDVRSGCYTSPHLHEYTERIAVADRQVSRERFAAAVAAVAAAAERIRESTGADATEFELLTAVALLLFRGLRVEAAVLEVGMGGRWDATSVVDPQVSVISGVGLDHTEHLGSTREAIAAEKAQIICQGAPVVLGPGTAGVESVFVERAKAEGCPLTLVVRAADEPTARSSVGAGAWCVTFDVTRSGFGVETPTVADVHGRFGHYTGVRVAGPAYQAANAAVAIAATERYLGGTLDGTLISRALQTLHNPARFEVVAHEPVVVVDGSHNPEAAAVLAGAVHDTIGRAVTVVLGMLSGKDARGVVRALEPIAARWVVTEPASPRALAAPVLVDIVRTTIGAAAVAEPSVAEAVDHALGDGPDAIVVTGSLTTAGEARRHLLGREESDE